ncbi:MAG: hypothetical protein E7166_04740 [Firmicutes bacterium]|nr:hypothetical protein [Bacillota bacterium]
MVEKELLEYYKNLDENEKRNQISAEFEKLTLLLDSIHKQFNIEKMPSSIESYNKATDSNMSNEDFFNLMYENIIYLRKDILTLVNSIMIK